MAFGKSKQVIVRYRTRAARRVKHFARGAAKRAWHRKALVAAPIVGLALGWVHDNAASVPTIPVLGATGTVAGAMTVGAMMMPQNDWLAAAAASALAIATYQLKTEGHLTGEDDGI